jgi:Phytanoyl-CoA dioxygenase (PhyH)
MVSPEVARVFREDGFVVLPAYLSKDDIGPAQRELAAVFPSGDEFHDDVDPERNERFRDEFGGIVDFPFGPVELSLLAVHHRLIELAEGLLGTDDLRVYSIEAWAKYTGAATYDQSHHRDYLNHSLLVPAPGQGPVQAEMFLYLSDVPAALGPPSYVPLRHTGGLKALPNWYPRVAGVSDPEHPGWVSGEASPQLYDVEVSAAGAAGTVVAYRIETFHRGTELVEPRGARFTIHVSFRRADAEWIVRRAWTDAATRESWDRFVVRATPRQLRVFGFPPPGHPYWTAETLHGLGRRYPGVDTTGWASRGDAVRQAERMEQGRAAEGGDRGDAVVPQGEDVEGQR